jgi:competence protein ComEA
MNMKHKKLIKAGSLILFILLTGIFYSCKISKSSAPIVSLDNSLGSVDSSKNLEHSSKETEEKDQIQDIVVVEKLIYVHLCGAVNNPDVYVVKENTRLVELIELAGGLTKEASDEAVNQAAILLDGEQIYIPTKEEMEQGTGNIAANNAIGKVSNMDKASGKININKATQEELMTLPGIGEAKALSIIKYRSENNGFKSIEEIKNISGIKDSVYNKISDKITI